MPLSQVLTALPSVILVISVTPVCDHLGDNEIYLGSSQYQQHCLCPHGTLPSNSVLAFCQSLSETLPLVVWDF